MKKLYLSVIIPAYDEEENIKKGVLEEAFNYLKKQKYYYEIIIVNDGSTDGTAEFIKNKLHEFKNFNLLNINHRGKGWAIIEGIINSRGKIILFTDMDQSTQLNQLEKFLPEFEKGYDIVIGSRKKRSGEPFVRKLTGSGFILLKKLLLNLPYKDTQCGFKAFKKESIEKILKRMIIINKNKITGPSYSVDFDLEILYLAKLLNLKVKEVPVEWRYKKNQNFNPIIHSWQAFKGIVTIKLNMLLGKYKY